MKKNIFSISNLFVLTISLTIFLVFTFLQDTFAKNTRPVVWGKVLKTQSLHGHNYFIFFKINGKSYAYPLSTSSPVKRKKLNTMSGKYARIYGREKIEKINLEGTSHILTYEVIDIKELTLADINQDFQLYQNRIDPEKIVHAQIKSDRFIKDGVSDKTINKAIFTGGSILALEVLDVLLTQ